MTQGSEGGKPSPNDHKEGKNAAGEKPQVARTKLDINMDDLIEPLHGQVTDPDSASVDEQLSQTKVAKTMLESDMPTLNQNKELSESEAESLSPEDFKALRKKLAQTLPESATLKNRSQVEHSIQKEAAAAQKKKLDGEKNKKEKQSVEKSPAKKDLARTIPESEARKKKLEADTSKPADNQIDASSLKKLATTIPESESTKSKETQGKQGEDEPVSLKELAKTIPDPPMQERKAVARRIARIRSHQNTVQVKFSKTMTQANLESLDSLRESSQWKSPSGSSTSKKKPPVREQFVARTKLDHDILFQAVSSSKVKEEARVAALLVEKSKEAPKPPPVAVKAERQSSACPFKWEETDSKEKYRYCTKCQTAIYNFDGMELPEAEALIFNRENRDKFTLYSRSDGKFMTVDCPLQKKRQRDLIMGIIAAVALVIGACGLLMMMPQSQPGALSNSAPGGSTAGSSGASTSSSAASTSSSDVVTFSSTSKERPSSRNKTAAGSSSASGGGYQTFQLPSASPKAAQGPDPDEDGSFWKF